MIELPDDELDKLFRKSSEELDPQFDPEDWNSLKKRLDAHDGKTAGGWIKKWWPLALLTLIIIIIGTTLYLTTQKPKPAALPITSKVANGDAASVVDSNGDVSSEAKKNAEVKSNMVENDLEKIKTQVTDKLTESTRKEAKANIEPNKALRNKEERIAKSSSESNITDYQRRKKLPRSQSKTGGVYLEPNRSKGKGDDGAFSKNNIAESKVDEVISGRNAVNEQVIEQASAVKTSEEEAKLLISASMLASRPLNWQNKPENPAVIFHDSAVAEKFVAPETVKEDYAKWAVRLGYSPDLSTVGFKNYTKPGAAFSLLIEYGLSSRLYLQTGVVRSVKDYSANAGEYKLPKYVTDINTPYDVDGSCTMFEIPLGLRYNVIRGEQSNWFIGSGVSSYYAQKEQYKYHYAKYVHKQKEGWDGKTGWFLLSHINASVGYERSITKKLSLVAEPYIRIPIKGVGYGKVNLTTVGMWISLRYTPAFK